MMRKSVCHCALLTACAALFLCVAPAAFAGEAAVVIPVPGFVPMGQGTADVVTGATVARPPLPPPGAAPSARPDATGDLVGAPAIPPGVPTFVPPARHAVTLGTPVAGRPNLFLIRPDEVREAISRGFMFVALDVRDSQVRDAEGYIAGDAHVPFGPVATFPVRVQQVVPTAAYPLVVYCSDGVRSAQAAEALSRMGYRVYLLGAYSLWARG